MDAKIPALTVCDADTVDQVLVIEFKKGQIMGDFIIPKREPHLNSRPLSQNQRKIFCFRLQNT
jgi:hypothetical protein